MRVEKVKEVLDNLEESACFGDDNTTAATDSAPVSTARRNTLRNPLFPYIHKIFYKYRQGRTE